MAGPILQIADLNDPGPEAGKLGGRRGQGIRTRHTIGWPALQHSPGSSLPRRAADHRVESVEQRPPSVLMRKLWRRLRLAVQRARPKKPSDRPQRITQQKSAVSGMQNPTL